MKTRSFAAALTLCVGGTLCLVPASALASADPAPGQPAPQVVAAQDGTWFLIPELPANVLAGEAFIRAERGQASMLNLAEMRRVLSAAPLEGTPDAQHPIVVLIPNPEGRLERFYAVESPIMEPGLAAQFPEMKTYLGWGIDDPSARTRFDVTTHGFRAQVLCARGSWYVDPVTKLDTTYFQSYFKRDLVNQHAPFWRCDVNTDDRGRELAALDPLGGGAVIPAAVVVRRQYRLANACTGEYAAVFGGTVAGAQSAIVTAINRVTQVYELEVAVRLVLVANNTSIVYTNASTDPFTNNSGTTLLGQNQTTCDTVIGNANYDVGHVFSTGGGGVAGLGVTCATGNKARGVTGLPNPVGDPFYIDYVAHEIGHQFGASHTFNGNDSNCNANRSASQAYEPGSGSTIMAYAGICAPNNVQNFSDPYFSFISIQQITARLTGGGACSANTSTANNTPVVSAGATFTIPIGTPFTLTATGSDPDGNSVTYCWEQRDLGNAQALTDPDNGLSPLFRSLTGTASPSRTFPRLSGILNGSNATLAEKLPAVARTAFRFRVTARDNVPGNGGTSFSDQTYVVNASAGPFLVTSQNSASNWPANSAQTVTWNVANTTAAPFSAANVTIEFSTDGGSTFPIVLVAGTPNDGSQSITAPNVSTSAGRVRVRPTSGVYFDINNGSISITAAPPSLPTNVFAQPNPACTGQTVQLFASVGAGEEAQWFNGTCGLFPIGTGSPINVVAGTSANTYQVRARRISDGAASSCVNLTVNVAAAPAAPSSATVSVPSYCLGSAPANVTLSAAGGSGATLRWFSGSCGTTPVGTGNNLVLPAPTQTTTYFARWETACGTSGCASTTVTVNRRADFNGDGEFTFDDIQLFVSLFNAQDNAADLNNDGEWTFDDVQLFVSSYNAGC